MGDKTEVTKYGEIIIESGESNDYSHKDILKLFAHPALDHIKIIFGKRIKDIDARLIFSYNFDNQLKDIHRAKTESENSSNAVFISIEHQSKEYQQQNQHIILINMHRLGSYLYPNANNIIKSVIIHELVHLYDYSIQFPAIKEHLIEKSSNERSKLHMYINGYFQYYSEFRAKYRQEYYFCDKVYILPFQIARKLKLYQEKDEIDLISIFNDVPIPGELENYILQRIRFNEKDGIEYSLSRVLGSFLAFERLASNYKWTNLTHFIKEERIKFNHQYQNIMDEYFCLYKDLLEEIEFFNYCISLIEQYE